MNTKQKNLSNLTDREWAKYKTMKKVAHKKNIIPSIILYSILIIFSGILIGSLFSISNNVGSRTRAITNYINTLNISLSNHSSLLLTSVSAIGQHMLSNPKMMVGVILTNNMALLSILWILALIIFAAVFYYILSRLFVEEINDKPEDKKDILKYYNRIQKMSDRLYAANYTQSDVEWYWTINHTLVLMQFDLV